MSGKLPGLRKRLIKMEQVVAARAREKELADCTCNRPMVAWTAAEYKAEMDRPCPVHGFRSLDNTIVLFLGVSELFPASDNERAQRHNAEMDEVMKEYNARKAARKSSCSELR